MLISWEVGQLVDGGVSRDGVKCGYKCIYASEELAQIH